MNEPNHDPQPPPLDPFCHTEAQAELGPTPSELPPASKDAFGSSTVPEPPRQSHLLFWLALGIGSLLYLVLLFVTPRRYPELAEFLATGIEVLPMVGLALLTYLGARHLLVRVLTLLYMGLLDLLFMLLLTGLTFLGLVSPEVLSGHPTEEVLTPEAIWQVLAVLGGVTLVLLASLVFYLPGVRRVLARVLPIDPDSFVHATALVVTVGYSLALVVSLLVLGEPVILLILRQHRGHQLAEEWSRSSAMLSEVYSLVWLVPGVFLAVGYPWLRNLREAAQRLGLVPLRPLQIGIACSAAVVLVLVSTGFDAVATRVWERLGWPVTDSKLFDELMKAFINPLGAVVIGVVAGLGEELVVRGLLQPRLGIVLSNLFFTSLHALQYNFDALLSVFLFGLILGLIRKYRNTTTSAIVHGMYDCLLILLAWAGVPGF
jgi:membrane protease YdiL (CAAX protease family)